MAGTIAGGKAAAATNKLKHGDDFYKRIGAQGGSSDQGFAHLKGFGGNRELARAAGAKGGRISKRTKVA